ncbi:MAG: tRNA (adenosine(37)-N6)-dimethylallyltransferase MiaA [Candidatus Omnitrophota bacterium]|nr:tRNA (adenosine(37)-N6)-dimethylallyltransferase MiaA [Candidatus Omnitrophota bacterium]
MKEKVIFLVGPTAVGKSKIAVEVAQAVGAEIISCDSMQVYRGMDIGTAKPGSLLRKKVPHYLIDIISPRDEFNCADFSQRSQALIAGIIGRKKIPLLVGGSGLYLIALVDGLFSGPPGDQKLRNELARQAELHGSRYLYQRLKILDPPSAEKIHPHDQRRIIRGLEVYEKTKVPISRLKPLRKGISSQYEIKIIGLDRQRQDLYSRIDRRVDKMFDDGLINEVRGLVKKGLSPVAGQALGYKEIIAYLNNEYDFSEAGRILKRNTRRFAKRQLSWFRHEPRVEWIKIDKGETVSRTVEKVLGLLKL